MSDRSQPNPNGGIASRNLRSSSLRFLLDVVIAARRLGLLDSLMSNGFAGFKAWPNLATRFKALSGAEKSREQAGQR